MVITGIIEGGVFCQDMGILEITDVSDSITVDYDIVGVGIERASFAETYYPDLGRRVEIHGLGNVALDYFYNQEIRIQHSVDIYTVAPYYVDMTMTIRCADGQSSVVTQRFYYSKCRVGKKPSTYYGFLNRLSVRNVRREQFVCLSYHSLGQKLVLDIAYKSEGELLFHQQILETVSYPGFFVTRFLSLKAIVELLNEELDTPCTADDIMYYETSLYFNESLVDRIHFDIDRRHYPQITHFVFYNCFGFPETLYFTGQDERASELEASFGFVLGNYLKVDTDLITSHTVNTGYIKEAVRDSVEDMVYSSKVYLYEKETLGDLITITDIDFTESKPRTEPLNIKLTYRVADKCQRKFARENFRDGIFDRTFDSTFD